MKKIIIMVAALMLMAASAYAANCDFTGYTEKGIQKCFGAVGPHCEGAPGTPTYLNKDTCKVEAYVSVGSILHDNCCLDNPKGKYCDGVAAGVGDDLSGNDKKVCSREWRKAVYNSRDGRTWKAVFGPYKKGGKGDDLARKRARAATTTDHFGGSKKPYKGKETVTTRRLAGAKGTKIDYTDSRKFCKSGKFAFYNDVFDWAKYKNKHYMIGLSDWGECQ